MEGIVPSALLGGDSTLLGAGEGCPLEDGEEREKESKDGVETIGEQQ